tara:strand:- start:2662 stop:3066 length:405 start_codon:yes stop_codon:yes gene_type:complete
MYKISAYSTVLHQQSAVMAIYSSLVDANMVTEPKIFYDRRTIDIVQSIPLLNTWHLCAATELVLTDNTVYDIADVYKSNRFIAVDLPCRHSAENVDHYSIEPFAKSNSPEITLKLISDILSKEEYSYAKIQQTV